MKIKRIISAILIILPILFVNGCNDENTISEKTQIRFAFWEPGLGNGLEEAIKLVKESYEKIHPDVEIKLITQPVGSYQAWLKTQLAINDAPEIISNHSKILNDLYVAGYIVDLKDAYNKETPYSNGEVWGETFKEECVARAHNSSLDGMYAVPLFDAGLAVYYNKDIYDKLNLEVPETWNEYMENCEKIENSGIIPIAMPGQGDTKLGWIVRQVTVGLCGKRILSDENINFNGDCVTSDNEIIKAIDNGYFDFTTNDEYRKLYLDCFEMVREYLSHCTNASEYDEVAAKMLFVSGEAAHMYSGSWDLREIMLKNNSKFDVGVFQFPKLTKENGEWAGTGISYNVTQPVAITETASEEKKAIALDFLQYMTSKDVYEQFIESAFEVPVLKNMGNNPVLEGFVAQEGYPENGIFQFGSEKNSINSQKAFEKLMSDPDMKVTDDMFEEFQKSMIIRAKELKEAYNWNKENDYKIEGSKMIVGEFE